MIIKLIAVALFIVLSFGQKTECDRYVEKLINDILDFKIAEIPLPSIMYSGKTANNPGQMEECQASNYSYYLVFLKNITSRTQSFTGLCMPNQCTASDIELALQFLHCRVYDEYDLKPIDIVAKVGGIIVLCWVFLLVTCSCYISFKRTIVNEYLINERSQVNTETTNSVSADPSTETHSQSKQEQQNIFNYYQGYKRLFKISNKANVLSLILFLAVVSFSVSIEFSYRQNIAQNTDQVLKSLDSFWGIFVCNVQIALHTIIFVIGFRLAFSLFKIRNFRSIGRQFFDSIMKKWLILILMSLLVYSATSYLISEPLSKLWNQNNGKDCPNYIWQIWFVFRNLQLDCKICLPWLTLLQGELLFTILSAPFIIIFRVSKKLGYSLILVVVTASTMISYAILKNQGIVFEPYKLTNSQKQYYIDYQGNAFVRMGAFFVGLFFGLFITQGLDRRKSKSVQALFAQKVVKTPVIQWALSLTGLIIMIWCYLQIEPYLNINYADKQPFMYLLFSPLGFVVGLGLFIIPCCWEGESIIARVINTILGWPGFIHLDRISLNFYLIAPMVIGYSTYSSQNSIYYDFWTVFVSLIGDLFMIYFLSILITASFQNQLIHMVSWLQFKILGKQSPFSAILIEEL